MTEIATIQALTAGHALDLHSVQAGVVHSVFNRAVNLVVRADMWTLLAAEKADLPFGIRVALSSFDKLGLSNGDTVNVRSGFIGLGSDRTRFVVDCRAALRWVPAFQDKPEPGLDRRLALVAAVASDRSWCESAPMARALMAALDDETALGEVVSQVVGRGPGATPAGDDVLVGILAVLTSPCSGAAGARAAETLSRCIFPLLPTTTEVSGELLRQAAHGLFGRDVHELVSAVVGAAAPGQLGESVRRVVETGATSGADTCEGLLAFAPSFFITHDERAAA